MVLELYWMQSYSRGFFLDGSIWAWYSHFKHLLTLHITIKPETVSIKISSQPVLVEQLYNNHASLKESEQQAVGDAVMAFVHLQDPETWSQDPSWPLSSWTHTFPVPLLWQKAPDHQDQDLMPSGQFLFHCSQSAEQCPNTQLYTTD